MNSTAPDLNKFLRIPFVDGGRDFSGADCWGLVMLIFKEFGIDLPDFKISCALGFEIDSKISEQKRFWNRLDSPKAPCLVVMKTSSSYPHLCRHLGVYVGDIGRNKDQIIHTFKKIGAGRISVDHPYFGTKIEGYYVPAF